MNTSPARGRGTYHETDAGDSGGSNPEPQVSVSMDYFYECPLYDYRLEVTGIILEKVNGAWQIVDWEEICERRGRGRLRCMDQTLRWK